MKESEFEVVVVVVFVDCLGVEGFAHRLGEADRQQPRKTEVAAAVAARTGYNIAGCYSTV